MMSLFIAAIMTFSVVGYAVMSVPGQNPETQAPEFSTIMEKQLDSSEKLYLLRTGMLIMEYAYDPSSAGNITIKSELEMFTRQLSAYMVLSEFNGNGTYYGRMTGMNGNMEEIENFTEDELTGVFCELAMKQPPECVLREF